MDRSRLEIPALSALRDGALPRKQSLLGEPGSVTRPPLRSSMTATWSRVNSADSIGTEHLQRANRRRHTLGSDADVTPGGGLGFTLGDTWKKVENSVGAVRGPFHERKRAYTIEVKDEMLEYVADKTGRVQADKLGNQGFTTEDLSRVLYDQLKCDHLEDMPDFLENICLEKKGGLHRIGDLWHWSKYIWFFLMSISGICNITYLLHTDFDTIHYTFDVLLHQEGLKKYDATDTKPEVPIKLDSAYIGQNIENKSARAFLMTLAFFVALCEILWILQATRRALLRWWKFAYDTSEFRAFHGIVLFFQKELPEFSTFSAIKLMATVHPSLIFNEYLQFVNTSTYRATPIGQVVISIWFFSVRIFFACAALSAFGIKLLSVGLKLINPQVFPIHILAVSILALMNQCMGCVHIEHVLQERLHLFVFGGQDAAYDDNEHAYKNVYECQVAKQMWQEFWVEKRQRFKAIVMLATFDHYDLQRLLINNSETFEVRVGRSVSHYSDLLHAVTPGLIPGSSAATDTDSISEVSPSMSKAEQSMREAAAAVQAAVQIYRSRSLEILREQSREELSLLGSPPTSARMVSRLSRETTSGSDSTCSVGMAAVTRALRNEDLNAWSDMV